MAKLDFAMLTSRSTNGCMTTRRMSNNGNITHRGDSNFFTDQGSAKIEGYLRE